eukprot:344277_1
MNYYFNLGKMINDGNKEDDLFEYLEWYNILTINDENKYKVVISVFMPFEITIDGLNNNVFLAEYYAFYNLFNIIIDHKNIDKKLLRQLIKQYDFDVDHKQWNDWWFRGGGNNPIRRTLDHFYGLNNYYKIGEQEKGIYFYNVNIDFDHEFKNKNLTRNEKQCLWYHAVSYLYSDIIKTLSWTMKDLLLFLMSNFY